MQKKKKTYCGLWITILIHNANGCGEKVFSPHLLALFIINKLKEYEKYL
jgi:hypothetical protein